MAKAMPVGTIRNWESGVFIKAHDSTLYSSGWIPASDNQALSTLGSELDAVASKIIRYKEPIDGGIYLDHELEKYAEDINDPSYHPDNFKQYDGFYGAGKYSFRNQLTKKFMNTKLQIEEYVQNKLVEENVKKAEAQGIYDSRKYGQKLLSPQELKELRKYYKEEAKAIYREENISVSDFDGVKKIVYKVEKNLSQGYDLKGEEEKVYNKTLYYVKDILDNYQKLSIRRKEVKELKEKIKEVFSDNWALEKTLTDKVTDAYAEYVRKYKDKILVDSADEQQEMFGVTVEEQVDSFYKKVKKKLAEDPEAPFQELMFLRFSTLYNKAFEGEWKSQDISAIENLERVIVDLPKGHFVNNEKLRLITNVSYKGGSHGGYAWYSAQERRINFSDECVREGSVFGVLSKQSEFNTVVAHEIGHAVSQKLGRSGYYDYKRFAVLCGWSYQQKEVKDDVIITGSNKDLRREGRYYQRPLLTNYAHKSPEEAFAEYYSFYFANKDLIDKWIKSGNDGLLSQKNTVVYDNTSPISDRKVSDFLKSSISLETMEKIEQAEINRKLVFSDHTDFKLISSSDAKYSLKQEKEINDNKYAIRNLIKSKADTTKEGIAIAIEKNGKYNIIENGTLVKAGFYLKKPINTITVSDEYFKNMQSSGFSAEEIKSYLLIKFNNRNLSNVVKEPKQISGLTYRDKIIDKELIKKNKDTLAMMQTIFNSDELQKAIDDLFYKGETEEIQNYGDSIIRYGEKILLLMRSKQDGFHPGVWCLPGGKVEKDEHPTDGAIRELFEETGLIVKNIFPVLIVKKKNCKIHYYQGFIDQEKSPLLDNDEHSNYQWFTVDQIKEMDSDLFILDLKERLLDIVDPDFKVKFVDESSKEIEKSEVVTFYKGKLATEGEIREWGGKKYQKTGGKWIEQTQGRGPKKEETPGSKKQPNQEEQPKKKYTPEELTDLAKKASEKDLRRVISESKQEEIRKVAQNELARRKKEETPQQEDSKDNDFKDTWGINDTDADIDQQNQNNDAGGDKNDKSEYKKKSAEIVNSIKEDRTDSYGDFYGDNTGISINAIESILKEIPELFQGEDSPYIADTLTTDMNFVIDSFPDKDEIKRDDLSWTISGKISDEQLVKINQIMSESIKKDINKFYDIASEKLKEATDNFHSASDSRKSSASFDMELAEERFEKIEKIFNEKVKSEFFLEKNLK